MSNTNMPHIDKFLAARRVSTPLVCIKTMDQSILIQEITDALVEQANKKTKPVPPICVWDCIRGLLGKNPEGQQAVFAATGKTTLDDVKAITTNPTECIEIATKLPAESVIFIHNAHAGFDPPNPNYIQAIWNLRDIYRENKRQIVLLTSGTTLPPELAQDIVTIDEPLPNPQQLEEIVNKCFEGAKAANVPDGVMPKAIDALVGLAPFPAEQVTAMSMFRDDAGITTLDFSSMWDRKRSIVEATPGLSIYRGTERFDDIGGLDNIKLFLRRFLNGKRPPRVILFLDEIEKMVAGQDNDTSGTSQMQLGKWLTWTQEKNSKGLIKTNGLLLVGHAGVGKSIISKACGNEANCPTVIFDLGSTRSSLVGSSEARMDMALKVVDAIGQGEILIMASCNKIEALTPEFRSRFLLGTWFFDLPTASERDTIWNLHGKRFNIDADDPRPSDEGWVGREIESCCQIADVLSIPLRESAGYITPSITANAEAINSLRVRSSGRFISASHPGTYKHEAISSAAGAKRAISLDED